MAFAFIFESAGVGEWLVLLAVVLIVVGPKRLPETARKFGQYYSKFRRAADGFKRQLMEMDSDLVREVKDAANEMKAAAEEVSREFTPEPPSGGYSESGDYGAPEGDYAAEEVPAYGDMPDEIPAAATPAAPPYASASGTSSGGDSALGTSSGGASASGGAASGSVHVASNSRGGEDAPAPVGAFSGGKDYGAKACGGEAAVAGAAV